MKKLIFALTIITAMGGYAQYGSGGGISPSDLAALEEADATKVDINNGTATNLMVVDTLSVTGVLVNTTGTISGTDAGDYAGVYTYAGTDGTYGNYYTNSAGMSLYTDVEGFFDFSWLLSTSVGGYDGFAIYGGVWVNTSSYEPADIVLTGTPDYYLGSSIVMSDYASIAAGDGASASKGSVAFGVGTTANNQSAAFGASTASGGLSAAFGASTASGYYSAAFGYNSTASGIQSVAFGFNSTASGNYSAVFGFNSTASGVASTAFGYRGKAIHDGATVFADYQEADFNSVTNNTFNVRAQGGVFFAAPRISINSGAGYKTGITTNLVYEGTNVLNIVGGIIVGINQ